MAPYAYPEMIKAPISINAALTTMADDTPQRPVCQGRSHHTMNKAQSAIMAAHMWSEVDIPDKPVSLRRASGSCSPQGEEGVVID